jgi:simple sugar transport system ATP-binding protein
LQLTGIHKRFGPVVAIDRASLTVRRGSVHALLGENGAGKSTLMRIAFGLTQPDEGAAIVDGRPLRLRSPADAIREGIGMVQQHFTLVPAMTALENISLGVSAGRRISSDAMRLARQLGVRLDSDAPVGQLSVTEQQRIELLKVLTRGARVLILDEPTAALAPQDADGLFSWLREYRKQGHSVVLITHKLREALAIADDVTVLRRGTVTWHGRVDEASADTLVTAMLGDGGSFTREPATKADAMTTPFERGPVAFADRVNIRDAQGVIRVRDATMRVVAGEILGVAGIEGSGSHELLYALAGRRPAASGELRLPDEIGFVPEDRQHDALLLDEPVADNVALRGAGSRRGWLSRTVMEAATGQLLSGIGIRVPDRDAPASTLSGGQQQRLVLARELNGSPSLIVAVNPTRGLDIAATNDVQQRLRDAAAAGMAIVYYSADLDELMAIADRIIVVFEGRVHEVPRDRDAVGRAMLGAA